MMMNHYRSGSAVQLTMGIRTVSKSFSETIRLYNNNARKPMLSPKMHNKGNDEVEVDVGAVGRFEEDWRTRERAIPSLALQHSRT